MRTHLEKQGIYIEADFEWPDGGRSIYFRDPAGNCLEFAEPRIWGIARMTRRLQRGDRLVVATHNPGKVWEINKLIEPYGLAAVSAGELGLDRAGRDRDDIRRQRQAQGAVCRQGLRAAGIG